jgi:inosine-uridine nucleoside N-ribohydrolase
MGNLMPASSSTCSTNNQNDPEAAQALISIPELAEKLIIVPLDLTHSAILNNQIQQRLLSPNPTRFRQMWIDLGRFFAKKYEIVFGFAEGPPLHDVCAVHIASLVGRGITSEKGGRWFGRKMHCKVDTSDGTTRGQTVCNVWDFFKGEGKITIAFTIEVKNSFSIRCS